MWLIGLLAVAQIVPPVLERFVEAEYPATELARRSEAVVGLHIVISAEGLVQTATVVESAGPAFDAAAMSAVTRFEFQPARLDGEAISVRILYRYRFAVHQEAPPPVVNLSGVVMDRWDKVPLADITVTLFAPATSTLAHSSTVTANNGRFAFMDVATGTVALRLAGEGVLPVTATHEIRAGVAVELQLMVEQTREEEDLGFEIDDEAIVRAPRVRKRAVETRIPAAQATVIPGTQGDTVKVVQNLPGVARSTAGSGDLIVWGASANNTRTYVDGIVAPRLFHSGGIRSTIGPELVESIQLAPGGYGPRYGRALGGLVTVETRSLAQVTGVRGHVAADVLDASASVAARVADNAWIAAGGRYGLLEHTLGSAVDEVSRELVPIPRYWDYQAKLEASVSAADSLSLLAFGSSDEVERTSNAADPSSVRSERDAQSYHRLGARWRRTRDDGSRLDVLAWAGVDDDVRAALFSDVPARLTQVAWRGGFAATEQRKLHESVLIRGGVDIEVFDAKLRRLGSVTEPPREGDLSVFGAPFSDRTNSDAWSIAGGGLAVWSTVELSFGPVTVQPGLRVEATVTDGSSGTPPKGNEPEIGFSSFDLAFNPRLSGRVEATSWMAFEAAAGLYSQAPDPADLSAVFGNPQLEPAGGQHVMLSTLLDPIDGLDVELTGFFTRSEGLATRSLLPTPPIAEALVARGEGRAGGMQVLLRYTLNDDLFGWVAYTLMRAERRDADSESWRLFDGDQTHVLSAVASYEIGLGFTAGARFRYASGFPRTPVASAYFNARDGVFEPVFGEQNTDRLPDFLQLDVRVAWSRVFDPIALSVYLDVQNITHRTNPEDIVYTRDFSRSAFISGLPFLPVLGIRAEL